MPYLGRDFGMERFLALTRAAVADGAVVKLRGREQEGRVAARRGARGASSQEASGDDAAAAPGGESPPVLLRRLTIYTSKGPDVALRWFQRVSELAEEAAQYTHNVIGYSVHSFPCCKRQGWTWNGLGPRSSRTPRVTKSSGRPRRRKSRRQRKPGRQRRQLHGRAPKKF